MSLWSFWCFRVSLKVWFKLECLQSSRKNFLLISYCLQCSVMGQELFATGICKYLMFSWAQKVAGQVHTMEVQQGLWRTKLPSLAQELQILGDWGRQDMGLRVREGISELPWDVWCLSTALAVYEQIRWAAFLTLILLHFYSSTVVLPVLQSNVRVLQKKGFWKHFFYIPDFSWGWEWKESFLCHCVFSVLLGCRPFIAYVSLSSKFSSVLCLWRILSNFPSWIQMKNGKWKKFKARKCEFTLKEASLKT